MPSSSGSVVHCLVCCELADGQHFGAHTCRACAAFFRRIVQLNKKLECPKNCQCFILSNVRNMCRACRYDKCISVGMKRSAVQQRRELLGKRVTNSQTEIISRGEPVLDVMHEAYNKMLAVRKVVHNRAEDHKPRAISFNEVQDILAKEMTVIYHFLCESFPEYAELYPDTKRSLFKNFFLPFILLESSYYCYVDKKSGVMIIPSGDFIDVDHLDTYFNNNYDKFSQEDTISLFSKQFEVLRTCITHPLSAENVDILEFLALSALVLWESNLETEKDRLNAQESSVQIRQAVIKDLLFHYQSINVYDDVSLRLGKIMSLLPSIQRASHRFHEFITMKDVLNLYSFPKNLYDMFSPVS